jgi:oligopeptide transport system substrate-binding protein
MKKKLVSLLLSAAMVASLTACGNGSKSGTESGSGTQTGSADVAEGDYTYRTYQSSLATNWNNHTWEMNADDSVRQLLATPLVNMSILDTETQEYQWTYEGATRVDDVTAEHQDDLVTYGAVLPDGMEATDVTEGYVFEIGLNESLTWQDGTPINADTYIYSMQQYLNPDMKNYRANNYYTGDYAIAGASGYFHSGEIANQENYSNAGYTVADLVKGDDGVYYTADGGKVSLSIAGALEYLGGSSLADYVEAYGDAYFNVTNWDGFLATADENGYVDATDENIALLAEVISTDGWAESEGGFGGKKEKGAVCIPV